jgi:hypothetical protein
MNDDRYAYVIMPVGSDPFYTLRRTAIQRGIKAAGLKPRFPTYALDKPAFKLAELKIALRDADVVVVDLSRERPSCYYELGIAEALNKRIASIAEAGTSIHQFAARAEVRFYKDIADIEKIVRHVLLEPAF